MDFQNARFADASLAMILVDVDGLAMTIPADPGNRHYLALAASGAPVAVPSVSSPEPVMFATAVSPFQARIALYEAGLLHQVEALMAHPDTPQAAKIAWEYATVIDRNSAFIQSLGPALGLTEENIDALFLAASQVT